jgi:hypothetical protein
MLSTAEEKFRTFLAAQNYPKPICWLMPGDVVARAHYIVTGNRKHFPAKWTDPKSYPLVNFSIPRRTLGKSRVKLRQSYARAAATIQHSEHHNRLFVRCVGDDVVAYGLEPQGFVVRSGLLCPWCGNSTSFRTASRMSSRTRRAARGLSSTINSQMSVMSCAAPG